MSDIPAEQWTEAWSKFPSTTQQQAALAEKDLERWLAGAPHASFDPFKRLLEPILPNFLTFLEVGSGWGGYCKVLKHISPLKKYCGCDISEHMVDYANEKWGSMFWVADSENLPDKDGRHDVVCISGLIQHLADHRKSIQEARRVAKSFVMIHRAEVTSGPSTDFIRHAYDSDIPTRKVNQGELMQACDSLNLRLEAEERWSVTPAEWNSSTLWRKM